MKLSELTPEQKRIAIAEACGWKRYEPTPESISRGYPRFGYWINPVFTFRDGLQNPPDYLNDLNAMASAESAKEMPYNTEYVWWLGRIACEARGMNPDKQNESDLNAMAVFATATQRADAFLLATGRAEL